MKPVYEPGKAKACFEGAPMIETSPGNWEVDYNWVPPGYLERMAWRPEPKIEVHTGIFVYRAEENDREDSYAIGVFQSLEGAKLEIQRQNMDPIEWREPENDRWLSKSGGYEINKEEVQP